MSEAQRARTDVFCSVETAVLHYGSSEKKPKEFADAAHVALDCYD